MPYLKDLARRAALSARHRRNMGVPAPADGAELNFIITDLIDEFIARHGLNYHVLEEIGGALTLVTFEFQRRVVEPYENLKIEENGDVYVYAAEELRRRQAARREAIRRTPAYAEVVAGL